MTSNILKSHHADIELPDIPVHLAVLKHWEQYGSNIALINGESELTITYIELLQQVKNVARSLQLLGVRKGDMVALFCPNCTEYIVMLLAVLSVGATASLINPAYTTGELEPMLQECEASYIFTNRDLLGIVQSLLSVSVKVILNHGSMAECGSLDDMMKGREDFDFNAVQFNPKEDLAVLMYSSGTTGLPKGVMLTHSNLLASLLLKSHPDVLFPRDKTVGGHTTLMYLPLFHSYGMSVTFEGLYIGRKIIILARFEPRRFLLLLQKYKVSQVSFVPPVVHALLRLPELMKSDLSSLVDVSCSAAPLAPDTQRKFRAAIGGLQLKQTYGLTETGPSMTYAPRTQQKHGSSGLILPNTQIKVLDVQSAKELGAGEEGEICVKGPQVMKGYWKRPEETRKCLDSDGWLRTGDLGYYDVEGNLYLVDRLKELIKYKGFQVAPAELEALLVTHPSVSDAAVVGVPDEYSGELPKAFVVRKPETWISEREVKSYVKAHLAPFKQLRGGVEFVPSIPKSASGKILRKVLRQRVSKPKL